MSSNDVKAYCHPRKSEIIWLLEGNLNEDEKLFFSSRIYNEIRMQTAAHNIGNIHEQSALCIVPGPIYCVKNRQTGRLWRFN